jgi:vesicle coat complex subunit
MVALSPATILPLYRDIIPALVKIVGDTTGIVRKNASICLAKLCNDKKNLELAKSLHGEELLINLNKYING